MTASDDVKLGSAALVMQVMWSALLLGQFIFIGVAISVRFNPGVAALPDVPMIAYFAAAATCVVVIAHFFMPGIVIRGGIEQLRTNRPSGEIVKSDLFPIYQTGMIMRCAALEGAAFFNILAFMLVGQFWSLGIVVGLWVLMALNFPSRQTIDEWAGDQIGQLQLTHQALSTTTK